MDIWIHQLINDLDIFEFIRRLGDKVWSSAELTGVLLKALEVAGMKTNLQRKVLQKQHKWKDPVKLKKEKTSLHSWKAVYAYCRNRRFEDQDCQRWCSARNKLDIHFVLGFYRSVCNPRVVYILSVYQFVWVWNLWALRENWVKHLWKKLRTIFPRDCKQHID